MPINPITYVRNPREANVQTQTKQRGRGRPSIGKAIPVRFDPEFLAFAQQYADEHTGGNVNAALREIGNLGRSVVEQREAAA